jgi:hypothetical protein
VFDVCDPSVDWINVKVGCLVLRECETEVHQLFESTLTGGIIGVCVGDDVGRHLQ